MTKGSLLYKLDNWKDKYNVNKGIMDLEKELEKHNLSIDNIVSILKYSRDEYGEISVVTKPISDIGFIRFDKIK